MKTFSRVASLTTRLLIVLTVFTQLTGCVWMQIGGRNGDSEVVEEIQRAIDDNGTQLILALNDAAWQLPLCVRRLGETTAAHCVEVHQLIQKYPARHNAIRLRVVEASFSAYQELSAPTLRRAQILEKLSENSPTIGCVNAGPNRGVVTIGVPTNLSIDEMLEQDEECSDSISNVDRGDALFGLMAGSSSWTPSVTAAARGSSTVTAIYEQCESDRKIAGQVTGRPVDGSEETVAERLENLEIERAREREQQAKNKKTKADGDVAEAEENLADKKEEKKKADDNLERVLADPNSTEQEIRDATNRTFEADADLKAAQVVLSRSERELEEATQQANDATSNREAVEARIQERRNFYRIFEQSVRDFVPGVDQGQKINRFIRDVWDHYSSGGDCFEGECATTCEERAAIAAIRAELESFEREVCDLDVEPLPDDEACYTDTFAGFAYPEVSITQAWKWSCNELRKYSDIDCRKLPGQNLGAEVTWPPIDPCVGPLVMCQPDNIQKFRPEQLYVAPDYPR